MRQDPSGHPATSDAARHQRTDAASLDTSHASELDLLPPPPPPPRQSPPPALTAETSTTIGDYELLEEIDRGGMGIVYRARQKSLDRIVAIKMIRGGALARQEDLQRFRSEAQAAARLQHANIVAIHEVGEHLGQPFYSMDFVDGTTLGEFAARSPLATREAVRIVKAIAEAVHAAHEHGILHRDLKPANVLIDRHGVPQVTDFGLAKQLHAGPALTATEQVLGTPSYMPPEQATGQSSKVGFTSDVYSLGAILYELLSGRPPFRADSTVATIRQVIDTEPISPRRLNSTVSRDIETICLKCLEKNPQHRYATARDLADELQRVISGEPIRARPLGVVLRGWRWCRRNPAGATAFVLLLAMAVAGPTVAVYTTGLLHRAQMAEKGRIAARIRSLRSAAPEAVDAIVQDLNQDGETLRPQLSALWDDPALTDDERTRISVALLAPGSPQFDYAYQRLLRVDAREFDMLRQALAPYNATLLDKLWSEVAVEGEASGRLNAAAALALYDARNAKWSSHGEEVANRLVRQDSFTAAAWAGYFAPVKPHLIPQLCAVYRDATATRAAQRALATDLLSSYAADDPKLLAKLLETADARQFSMMMTPLRAHGAPAREALSQGLDAWIGKPPRGSDDTREQVIANLGVAMLQMGAPERLWPLLKHSPDPTVRTHLVHRLVAYGAQPATLAARLQTEPDVSTRRALILALGEADPAKLSPAIHGELVSHLESLYRGDADSGIHAAAEWTLGRWGEEDRVRTALASSLNNDPASPLGRYTTSEGQVMTVVRGPVEFRWRDKLVRIERSFAFAIKEVTREEYLRFERDPQIKAELEAQRKATNSPGAHWYNESWSQTFGPDPQCPHLSPPWTVAARYCRWLSEQEGISAEESCFVPVPSTNGPAILADDYLDRTGYRMPTAAEWEYMCRAGAETERYFGRSGEMLSEYAWYVSNAEERTWPVGSLKPNDFGLFDMHGNIREWCLNRQSYRPKPDARGLALDDEESNLTIDVTNWMVTLGGGYGTHPRFIRASSREQAESASTGNNRNGMRLARTLRLED